MTKTISIYPRTFSVLMVGVLGVVKKSTWYQSWTEINWSMYCGAEKHWNVFECGSRS